MQKLYLIAEIAGETVAIESDYIESVVHVQNVVAAPQCGKSVAGIFALRSRVLTLIDSSYIVTGKPSQLEEKSLAVIMEVAGHSYGLLIDRAYEVASISEIQRVNNISIAPSWEKIAKALAVVGGKTTIVVDPELLVTATEKLAA